MDRYTNVESLLVASLSAGLGVPVRTELPGGDKGLAPFVPLIRVVRTGGSDAEPTMDRPIVDIEFFDSTRAKACDGAEAVRNYLVTQFAGMRFNGGSVKKVTTISGPIWRPWDDLNVRRFGMSFEFRLHTQ